MFESQSFLPSLDKLLQSMNSLLVADFVNEWRGLWRIVIIGQLIKKLALGILLKIALSVSKGLITKMNQESDNSTLLRMRILKCISLLGVFLVVRLEVYMLDGVSFKLHRVRLLVWLENRDGKSTLGKSIVRFMNQLLERLFLIIKILQNQSGKLEALPKRLSDGISGSC